VTVLQETVGTIDVAGVRATVVGSGGPVTLLAHGIGGSTAETRPLASRLTGTRVLMEFRGHGRSVALPGGWSYPALADDIAAVAGATGATRAVGLSLGAGALMRLLARQPDRFERLAFVLPASLDSTRADGATARLERLGAAIDGGQVEEVCRLLADELPDAVRQRRGTALLLRRRALQLTERPSPRPLRDDRPLRDRRLLSAVRAPSLVLAQEADPLHRLDVARDLAAALPCSTLRVLPEGGVFWTAARAAQDALADHFAPEEPA
jgi:3-oxoadipate enol-lactonase